MDRRKKIILMLAACVAVCMIGCYALGVAMGAGLSRNPHDGVNAAGSQSGAVPLSVLASIVEIEVYDAGGRKVANASGFVAFEPKRLVTCRHVLEDMEYAICTCETGETFRIDTICEEDEAADIALCRLPEDCGVPPLATAQAMPGRGDGVIAVGSQFGMMNVVTRGNASMVKDSYILFTAPVSAGSSGGALLNNAFEVCGVVRGTYREGQNINTAVPIQLISGMIDRDVTELSE